MPGDINERSLDALEASTRATVEVMGHLKGMEREFVALREEQGKEFASLRDTFNRQIGELEDEMKSVNAHLDNLVRETQVTNQLLRDDMDDRKEVQKAREKVEQEERDWRREQERHKTTVEDDNRKTYKKYLDEFWGVFKQPFGYLIAGVIFWLLTQYNAVPPQIGPTPVTPTPVIEPAHP